MKDEIINTMVNLQAGTKGKGDGSGVNSYANAPKSRKNHLLAKSTDRAWSVANREDKLAGAPKGVPVVSTRLTSSGNNIMNLACEAERKCSKEDSQWHG